MTISSLADLAAPLIGCQLPQSHFLIELPSSTVVGAGRCAHDEFVMVLEPGAFWSLVAKW